MTNNPPDYPLDVNAIGNRVFILGILRQKFYHESYVKLL